MAIKAGDMAPNFTLQSQTGDSVTLSDFRGKAAVVLYFYPKDDTPGCTAESCTFRDRFQEFKDLGAEVIGISSDSPASHQTFANKYSFTVHLSERSRLQHTQSLRCSSNFRLSTWTCDLCDR